MNNGALPEIRKKPVIQILSDIILNESVGSTLDVENSLNMYNDEQLMVSKHKQNENENEIPNKTQTNPQAITISNEEYLRLLNNEIQLTKYKGICQKKSSEIKRLQDQLSYYKKCSLKTTEAQDNSIETENSPVNININ